MLILFRFITPSMRELETWLLRSAVWAHWAGSWRNTRQQLTLSGNSKCAFQQHNKHQNFSDMKMWGSQRSSKWATLVKPLYCDHVLSWISADWFDYSLNNAVTAYLVWSKSWLWVHPLHTTIQDFYQRAGQNTSRPPLFPSNILCSEWRWGISGLASFSSLSFLYLVSLWTDKERLCKSIIYRSLFNHITTHSWGSGSLAADKRKWIIPSF